MQVSDLFGEAFAQIQQRSKLALYQRDPEAWVNDVLGGRWWSKQREICEALLRDYKVLVTSCNGVGKGGRLDDDILTPTGWRKFGDLRVGDEVFDESGKPCRVTWLSPDWHEDCYEVEFSDGARVTVSGQHEWNVLTLRDRNRLHMRDGRIRDWRAYWGESHSCETRALVDRLHRGDGAATYAVPINGAIEFPEREYEFDPYVLGVWLGDGTSSCSMLTLGDMKARVVVPRFAECGVTATRSNAPGDTMRTGHRYSLARQGFKDFLRANGLLNNKHIPDAYLRGSIDQRWALLNGLMDTDGFVSKHSVCGIDFMNEALASDTVELIRSLGMRASITRDRTYLDGRDAGPRWRIVFNPICNPFSAGIAKAVGFVEDHAQRGRATLRTIRNITRVPTVTTRCIEVDSTNHLYLTGRYLIPTHNSYQSGQLAVWAAAVFPPEQTSIVLTSNTTAQIAGILGKYISVNFNLAKQSHWPVPGRLVNGPTLRVDGASGGGKDVIISKRPADRNLQATFQGIHDPYLFVFADEADGFPAGMWDAMAAVTTNAEAHVLAISNPNNRYSKMAEMVRNKGGAYDSWARIRIAASDSPNFTGELVYPDDPEKQALLERSLVTPEWAAQRKREAHESVYLAQVEGRYSEDDGSAFFSMDAINKADDLEIEPEPGCPVIWGVDIAGSGGDFTAIYENRQGRIRLVDRWQYDSDPMSFCEKLHDAAIHAGVTELRMDAAGIGHPYWKLLDVRPEFGDKPYVLWGLKGSWASPDPAAYAQARTYWYDQFREGMQLGLIDLDVTGDTRLRDEITGQPYEINGRGALQITPKKEMLKQGLHSPDELDAAIYSYIDPVDVGFQKAKPRMVEVEDDDLQVPGEELVLDHFYGSGMPF